MADKMRDIEAYLNAKINQAKGMQEIADKDSNYDIPVAVYWWRGKEHAYEDMKRILFGNKPVDLTKIEEED